MDYRTSWRRVRDFFGARPCTFASLRSLTPSAKTVHRTVFFRRLRLLPPCSNPLFIVLPKQKAGLATCFSFWRRVRDYFGALPCTFASLRSLTTSAKTVHRTVFFRRLRLLPPCSNPSFCFAKAKSRPRDLLFILAESYGFFRCTPVHLRVASLLDPVGKNSPPDCFLPQTASAPSLFESLFLFCQSKKQALRPAFHFGGELGIRTLGTLRTQHFESFS